jgi:hypothetical protein
MTLNSKTATLGTVVWAAGIVATGVVTGFGPFAWAVAGAAALLPAYGLSRMRQRDDPSLSEQIQKALH